MADNIRWFFNPESGFPIKGEIVDDVPDEFIERKMKEAEERGDLIDEWTVKYDFFAKTIAKEVVTKYPKAKPVNDELNEWLLFNDDGEEFLISRSKTPNFSWTDGAERFKKATCNQIYYATNDIKFAYEIVGKYIKVLYDRVRTLILTRLINK